MKIAWIGTGVMGSAMATHIKHAGHEVHVYNRSFEKANALAALGMHVFPSIKECIEDCDIIITMVGYPKDVEQVYCETGGIFEHAKAGSICIDMTTSSPKLAQRLYEESKQHNVRILDAPVSGGDSGAKAGTLSIMVGGDLDCYHACTEVFQCMGTSRYMGQAGMGQHTKACNQIAVAGAVCAMSEAIVYANANGLDASAMLEAIGGGAAGSWQIANTAPRVLREDFAPGFYIKHFIKDMHIVQEEMEKSGTSLEMLNTVCHMYEELAKQGEADLGTQALLHYYK